MNSTSPGSKVNLVISNKIADLEKVVEFVNRFGAAHNIQQAITNDLNLCLDELLNNTISYGFEDQGLRSIVVGLSLTDGLLIAEIQDDGKPFDPRNVSSAVPSGTLQSRKIGGLGIHFVKTLMDQVGYMRVGQYNVLRIAKRLQGETGNGDGDR
jgi:serine/threonine-protein kinase RsbW